MSNTNPVKPEDKSEKGSHVFVKYTACPAQDALNENKITLESEINSLNWRNNRGLCNFEEKKLLKKKEVELNALKKKLKSMENDVMRQRKSRSNKKRKLEEAMLEFPDLKKRLKMSDNQGRPRLEENHEGILEAILELATHGCAADERRSTDKLRTIKSIDELNAELKKNGL